MYVGARVLSQYSLDAERSKVQRRGSELARERRASLPKSGPRQLGASGVSSATMAAERRSRGNPAEVSGIDERHRGAGAPQCFW